MNLTMAAIKERLIRDDDPEDFVDALEITSEELLDRFEDKLIHKIEEFAEELEDEEEDEDEY